MVLICAPHHPLAQQSSIKPQDLASQTLLTYPVKPERLDIFKHFLHPANVQPKQIRTVEQANVLIQMVSADMGVAALPLWAVKNYQHQGLISTITLITQSATQGLKRQLFAAYRNADKHDKNVANFIQLSRHQWIEQRLGL